MFIVWILVGFVLGLLASFFLVTSVFKESENSTGFLESLKTLSDKLKSLFSKKE